MKGTLESIVGALSRGVGIALSCALLAAPGVALAKDSVSLCFERKDVPPWRTINGEGLNFELLKQVSSRLDLTFTYQSLPWKRCLAKLKANEVDGAFSVSFAHDRVNVGEYPGGAQPDFSKRMHVSRYYLVRKKGARIDWDGRAFHNVNGAIGYQLGYSVGDFLHAQNVPIDEANQRATDLIRQVSIGSLAGAAMFDTDVESLMNTPLASEVEMVPIPLIEKPYFLLLSHALVTGRPQLAAQIWKAVEEVRNSAPYAKLYHDTVEVHAH
jgi:polar amino acid transport system substrate-binding protein